MWRNSEDPTNSRLIFCDSIVTERPCEARIRTFRCYRTKPRTAKKSKPSVEVMRLNSVSSYSTLHFHRDRSLFTWNLPFNVSSTLLGVRYWGCTQWAGTFQKFQLINLVSPWVKVERLSDWAPIFAEFYSLSLKTVGNEVDAFLTRFIVVSPVFTKSWLHMLLVIYCSFSSSFLSLYKF